MCDFEISTNSFIGIGLFMITEKAETNTGKTISNPYDGYTNNALIDVILYQISSKKERIIDGNGPRNSYWTVNGDNTLEWINLKYAYLFLHRFFLLKPHKPFEIHKSHLTPFLIEWLERLDLREVNQIMVGVVRRILEAVDSYYYHTSGIHSKVIWRFID